MTYYGNILKIFENLKKIWQIYSEISTAIKAKGGRFLEAPVSGSKKPAEAGEVIYSIYYIHIQCGIQYTVLPCILLKTVDYRHIYL